MTHQIKHQEPDGLLRGIRDLFPVVCIGLLIAYFMSGGWGDKSDTSLSKVNGGFPLIVNGETSLTQPLNNLRELALKNGSVRVIILKSSVSSLLAAG
jgi:hypothetical protein